MSNKVKVVTCLSTTLRPKVRIRPQIPSIGSSTTSSPGRSHSQFHDPNLPGCSKWFSTTSSQSTISQRTFFSSNTDRAPPSNTLSESTPRRSKEDFESLHVNDEEFIQNSSIKTPHLPLPPKLPYSPNSYPFKRHLEILSLSLYSSSTPDESWLIYQSLDASLRRYIPDDTFKSLLIHQLQVKPEFEARAWNRVKILLRLAKKCEMPLNKIGSDGIIKILNLGKRRSREGHGEKKEETYKLVRKLWVTLEEMIPLHRISHEARRDWLGLQYLRLVELRQKERKDTINQIIAIEEIALDVVKRDGAVGLGYYIGEILVLSSGTSTKEGLQQSLRNLTWCLAKGVDIKLPHLLKVMRKLNHHMSSKEGEEDLEYIRSYIPTMLKSLNVDSISNTSRILYQALDVTARRSTSRVEKALDIIETNQQPHFGELVGRGISISISAQEDTVVKLEAALRLLELALQHKENSCDALISSLTIALQKARQSPTSSHQEIDALIIRYVRLLNEAQIMSQLPSDSIIPLFRLILLALPSSEAYILARKIYQYARSASPPFLWSRKNLSLWQNLFRYSITSPNSHLHFASRLYTDLMADEIPVRRQDLLMLIRAIGSKSTPSRAVLLERHIKDYLWASYGSPSPLILALVQGLTKGGIQDTDLALDLAKRLSQGKPLQPSVVELIINQLSKSTRTEDRIRIFQLLQQLDVNHESAIKIYNTVLSYLVTSSRKTANDEENKLDHHESLRYAIYLYREMIKNGVKPNSRTISNMIRILLDSGYLDESLEIFKVCINQNILIKSNSVGRLMINLAMKDRIQDAYQVESSWRELCQTKFKADKNGRIWDKGIIGARTLIDIKNGQSVNIDEVMKQTGWEGELGFLKFLESLKPPSSSNGEQKTEQEDVQIGQEEVSDVLEVKKGSSNSSMADEDIATSTSYWDRTGVKGCRAEGEGRKDGIELCMSSNYNVVYH